MPGNLTDYTEEKAATVIEALRAGRRPGSAAELAGDWRDADSKRTNSLNRDLVAGHRSGDTGARRAGAGVWRHRRVASKRFTPLPSREPSSR